MQGKKFLHSIRLKNLLSYGSEGTELELEPLNVLIGANASGKSNLIEAISLLAAAPRDLLKPIREGGGVEEWIWKGAEKDAKAEIHVVVDWPDYEGRSNQARFFLEVTAESAMSWPADLGEALGQIRFFRGCNLGQTSLARRPQPIDLPSDFLLEDASNLGVVLDQLKDCPQTRRLIVEKLKVLAEDIEDIETIVQDGSVQTFIRERGGRVTPAVRLPDGILHYLSLLAILCHPMPPPLICLEKPEMGIHPDVLRTVGELLIQAAERTQLIVTTHSGTLLSGLAEVPEAIVICEKGYDGTSLKRLQSSQLKWWLERYALGEIWSMGEIGGNRW